MFRRLALLGMTALLAACTGGSPPAASAPASASAPGSAATRIDVTLTDALKMEPTTMTVPAGVPVHSS